MDEQRYREVLAQLEYQAGQAEVWRDAVSNWFLRASGIPDAKGRVGNYPGRMEAESARLDGYKTIDVTPWEAASGGKAVECAGATVRGHLCVQRRSWSISDSCALFRPEQRRIAFPGAAR